MIELLAAAALARPSVYIPPGQPAHCGKQRGGTPIPPAPGGGGPTGPTPVVTGAPVNQITGAKADPHRRGRSRLLRQPADEVELCYAVGTSFVGCARSGTLPPCVFTTARLVYRDGRLVSRNPNGGHQVLLDTQSLELVARGRPQGMSGRSNRKGDFKASAGVRKHLRRLPTALSTRPLPGTRRHRTHPRTGTARNGGRSVTRRPRRRTTIRQPNTPAGRAPPLERIER